MKKDAPYVVVGYHRILRFVFMLMDNIRSSHHISLSFQSVERQMFTCLQWLSLQMLSTSNMSLFITVQYMLTTVDVQHYRWKLAVTLYQTVIHCCQYIVCSRLHILVCIVWLYVHPCGGRRVHQTTVVVLPMICFRLISNIEPNLSASAFCQQKMHWDVFMARDLAGQAGSALQTS